MKPFPDDWELVAFFEVEPRLLDDVPWVYNQRTCDSTRGSDQILCVGTTTELP